MIRRPVFVFDIGGTLLDTAGSIRAACVEELGTTLRPQEAVEFAAEWESRVDRRTSSIVEGESAWASSEQMHRDELAALLPSIGLSATGAAFDALREVESRSSAFADAAPGLDQLAEHAHLVGLTNTDLVASSASCAGAGLRWHALFSTGSAHTVKPRPEAYLLPEEHLGIDPARSYFVAAHPWDLRGARARGYRTVYIPRAHTDAPRADDSFDETISSIGELVRLARSA